MAIFSRLHTAMVEIENVVTHTEREWICSKSIFDTFNSRKWTMWTNWHHIKIIFFQYKWHRAMLYCTALHCTAKDTHTHTHTFIYIRKWVYSPLNQSLACFICLRLPHFSLSFALSPRSNGSNSMIVVTFCFDIIKSSAMWNRTEKMYQKWKKKSKWNHLIIIIKVKVVGWFFFASFLHLFRYFMDLWPLDLCRLVYWMHIENLVCVIKKRNAPTPKRREVVKTQTGRKENWFTSTHTSFFICFIVRNI